MRQRASGPRRSVPSSEQGASTSTRSAATSALADASACGVAAHYHGPGVLYMQRYIYEGDSGLFAVDVSANGTVSNLVRLTDDKPLIRPEVTGAGDLFAVALTTSASFNPVSGNERASRERSPTCLVSSCERCTSRSR